MTFTLFPYHWVLAFSAFVSLSLCLYAWRNRAVRSALPFFWAMLLVSLWITAQAVEIAAAALPEKLFWANVQYLSITMAPVAYLMLVLAHTGGDTRLRRRRMLLLLCVAPVALNALLWTDNFHGLIRQGIYLDSNGPVPVVRKTFGMLFWPFAAYNFSVTIASLAVLARSLRGRASVYRRQTAMLFTGLLLPVASTITHLSGILPAGIDPTPAVFGFAGTLLAYAIFRVGLFDLVPVAHSVVIERMNTGLLVFDTKDRVVDINPAGSDLLGVAPGGIIGLPVEGAFAAHPEILSLYRNDDNASGEITVESPESVEYYDVSFSALSDGRARPIGRLMLAHNVTTRKLAEEKIRHMAFHDHLTGLPNRKLFRELFAREVAGTGRSGGSLVVGFIDLDGFKLINDTYGHEEGDRFLCEVAERLRTALRRTDVVSRQGGDEFSLLLPGFGGRSGIEAVARNVFNSLAVPVYTRGTSLAIRASIGFSIYPEHGTDMDDLLEKADMAMYLAKAAGPNNYRIYSDEVRNDFGTTE